MGVHFGNGDLQVLHGNLFVPHRNMVQVLHDPAAHRNTVGFKLNIKELAEILQAHRAVNAIQVFAQLLEVFLNFIVLVPDLTNKLFQNVLHGDNAQRAAEIFVC